jgi:hypothetical protein
VSYNDSLRWALTLFPSVAFLIAGGILWGTAIREKRTMLDNLNSAIASFTANDCITVVTYSEIVLEISLTTTKHALARACFAVVREISNTISSFSVLLIGAYSQDLLLNHTRADLTTYSNSTSNPTPMHYVYNYIPSKMLDTEGMTPFEGIELQVKNFHNVTDFCSLVANSSQRSLAQHRLFLTLLLGS